jgi:hypothetical protein
MKKTISRISLSAALAALPAIAFAQQTQTLSQLAQVAVYYFNIAIELIIGLAIVTFVFNIYRYFFTTKENKERGMYLLWSIIGFFVIIAFWGLVNLVSRTFNFNTAAPTNFQNLYGSVGGTSSGSNPLYPTNNVGTGASPVLYPTNNTGA